MIMHARPITPADFPAITALVNAAYRGEASKAGWTTEAWLVGGERRTNEQHLAELVAESGAVILQLESDQGDLLGCVFLRHDDDGLYLGMLSVWPQLQAKGYGKTLLWLAEEHARSLEVHRIYMNVISARTELIDWYHRHGYRSTGVFKEFPSDPEFGIALQPLEFVVLEKLL
jgi:ribosomal protein S18 acetylase RimI-like enzyme